MMRIPIAGNLCVLAYKMNQVNKTILLVEDNADDAKLALRAFKRNNMPHPIVVARDGVEALDRLFARGGYAERAGEPLPTLMPQRATL